MDIVTHALIGLIGASAVVAAAPEAAAAFAVGSVLPDLDAFSRLAGKRAFLAAHQGWTHALPVQAAAAIVVGAAAGLAGLDGWSIGLGLWLGLAGHSLLDLSNTFGIALLAPFDRRRRCLEWVFFIDAGTLAACALTLAAIAATWTAAGPSPWPALAFAGFAVVWWTLRAALRRRAGRLAPPGTVALLPSALAPWRFLGTRRDGDGVETFTLDVRTGACGDRVHHVVLDDQHGAATCTGEFQVMRALSPAYHVVAALRGADGTVLRCRDLRTRNFATRFGALDLRVDAAGRVTGVDFHV